MEWRRPGLVAALAACALLSGCGQTGDPGQPGDSRISFLPVENQLTVLYGGVQQFAVTAETGPPPAAVFSRGDQVLGSGANYYYHPERVGPDSLRAVVVLPDTTLRRDWRIWVDGGYGDRPAPVASLQVGIGEAPGTLRVSWTRPPAVLCPRPLARYHVAYALDAAPTEESWDDAVVLEVVPHIEGAVGYLRQYAALPEGRTVYVAVRAEDTDGQLSPLGLVQPQRVAGSFRISGVLVDESGMPLPGLSVSVGDCDGCRALTQTDGGFSLGLFRDVDGFVLTARDENLSGPVGEFYDFRSDTLRASTPYPMEIVMIRARGLDAACGTAYENDFLTYFRAMTNTGAPNLYTLRKWDSHPIRYWTQEASASAGYAYAPIAREAASAWNQKLGADYYVETPDSADAQLVIRYQTMPAQLLALTSLTDPPGRINEYVPRRMLIQVHDAIADPAYARGILLHELGHALCLGAHSACGGSPPVHIMVVGARVVPLGEPLAGAIGQDEAAAVRLLSRLPQLMDMRQYLRD